MGQCISVPHRRPSLFQEGSMRRFYKSKTGHLSATFHILDSDLRWDLLNVNSATEEELMTLPGVNRTIARNIVEYRQTIGGFKKVEDLALVSGVGASKLEQFRSEICVGSKKRGGGSYSSSLSQSLESLHNADVISRPPRSSPLKLVNINTANVFQLTRVRGMSQEMAANIVDHRERKGPFKAIDDLLKVRGLTSQKLASVKPHLTLDPWSIDHNSFSDTKALQCNSTSKKATHHRRTKSAPSHVGKLRTFDMNSTEFYEMLSHQCTRPLVEKFNYSRGGRPAVRIATWNLQKFTLDKAKNPGVREVICRTILENSLSLVAVQEVASRDALQLITSELNDPQLLSVKSWRGDHGRWLCVLPPSQTGNVGSSHPMLLQNGFLYDSAHGVQLRDSTLLTVSPDKGSVSTCQPFLGWFKMGSLDFVVVIISLQSGASVATLLPVFVDAMQQRIPGERNVFLMGDFILPPGHTVFEALTSQNYSHLIPAGTSTNMVTQQEENHIWASNHVRMIFTGVYGVVKEGLSHLAIPKGWQWGGTASDYCPVWVELYTQDDASDRKDSPVTNGIRKVSTIPEDDAAEQSEMSLGDRESTTDEEEKKKKKTNWTGSWSWNKNKQKNCTVTEDNCERKENGSVT